MDRPTRSAAPKQHRRAAARAVKILRGQLDDPSPEERLWLAVIEQAVREAYSEVPSDPERRLEARQWLESGEFDEVAKALGLHPRWARDTIKRLERLGDNEAFVGVQGGESATACASTPCRSRPASARPRRSPGEAGRARSTSP